MDTATQHTTIAQQGTPQEVTADLAMVRTAFANAYLYGPANAEDRAWVLIDTGVPGFTSMLKRAIETRFGAGSRPSAIILTHGHFDHVGGIEQLVQEWEVPAYAHPMELPYLTGKSSYPPGDPAVGGGAIAMLSPLYPRGPIDLGPHVQPLPEDGSVPGMAGWRWIATPGHSPGHVALFRDADRTLIAGDALVTVKQESALAVISQHTEVNGPPAYFTPDWGQARQSFRVLAALEPEIIAPGHGIPLRGATMRGALRELAQRFDELAVPRRGRYVDEPATINAGGVVSVPPPVGAPLQALLLAFGGALALGFLSGSRRR